MPGPSRDDRIESLRAELIEARRQMGTIARRIEAVESRIDDLSAQRPTEILQTSPLPSIEAQNVQLPEPAELIPQPPAGPIAPELPDEVSSAQQAPADANTPEFGPQLAAFSDAASGKPHRAAHAEAFRRLTQAQTQGATRKDMTNAAADGIATLEKLIGGRWYAAIGALVVVIGVALFFKLAVQNGWIVFTPSRRCVSGVLFGLGLLGTGEFARRRWGGSAAAGLSAAGVGVLYGAVYAAYGLYALLDAPVAFSLLAAVAALGIFVGARAKLASVAALSLLGGYITPLIFADSHASPIVLPAYLLTLLTVALVLSAWLGGRFVALRSLGWWATILLGGAWALGRGGDAPIVATIFLALVWGAVHAELAMSSGRFGLSGKEPLPIHDQSGDETQARSPHFSLSMPLSVSSAMAWRPLTSSFSTSAWVFALGVQVYRGWIGGPPDWCVPAGMVLFTGMLAWTLSGNLRVLRDPPETDSERLGACLTVQTGALIIAAIALGTSGAAQTISWLSMGVAVVLAGRWMRSRGLDAYGLIVLSLATARAVAWDSWSGSINTRGVPFVGLSLTAWSLLMFGLAFGWAVVAFVLRRGELEQSRWRSIGTAAFGVAIVVFFAGMMHRDARAESIIAVALTMGLSLALAGRKLGSNGLCAASIIPAGVGSLLAAASIAGFGTPRQTTQVAGIELNAWSAARAYAGLVWIGIGWASFLNRGGLWQSAAIGAAGLGIGLLDLTVVNPHSSTAGISVAWVVVALAVSSLRFFQPRLAFDRWAMVGVLAGFAAWAVAYPCWTIEEWDTARAGVAQHPSLWIGLLACAAFVVLARLVLDRRDPLSPFAPKFISAAWAAALAALFAATSLEVARAAIAVSSGTTARAAAVSLWWGLFAAGLITAGFLLPGISRDGNEKHRGVPIVRQLGLLLLAVATGKALIIDLVGVAPIWRVASFVGLGLLMLAVAVVYSKASGQGSGQTPLREESTMDSDAERQT